MILLDLHIHSRYSFDSLMRIETILKTAKKKGLDMIAVTDHGTIRGGLEASRLKDKWQMDIKVVVGAEIPTDAGDIIGLFLSKEIRYKEIGRVIDEIHFQGGLVLLPHPLRGHRLATIRTFLNEVDLVEMLNSRSRLPIEKMNIIRGFGKKLVGFSDAHFPSEIGLCRTEMNPSYRLEGGDDIKKFLTETSASIIKGNFSSPNLELYSQLIRSVKLRHYRQIPLDFLSIIHQVVERHD